MPAVTLQAHYNGQQIVLDEPYDLPTNAQLMVTVLPPSSESEESWLQAASTSNAFAFLHDAGEDIYTVRDGEPFRDAV